MALYFPNGLNGKCEIVDYESELGRITTMIPLIKKIISDNDLDSDDVLVCIYFREQSKLKYFWGNLNLEPTPEKEAFRCSRDDFYYFIFFTEYEEVKQKLYEYLSGGGLDD